MNVPIVSNDRRKHELDKKLKQIESEELKLKALEEELLKLQSRMAREASPIIQEFCQLRYENLLKLQSFLTDSFFKKKEKRLISHLMIELAMGLQGMGDSRAGSFLADLLSEVEEDEAGEEEPASSSSQKYTHPPEKKTGSEGKLEIKTLFHQLAKAFHPDREPEEHLKEVKTSLMKKITQAYENQDLYGLLKLEKEHLGPREFTQDKLELYIKHINDRIKELKIFEAKLKKHGPLSAIYRFIYSRKTTMLEFNLRNELSKIEAEVEREKELQIIVWDKSTLRNYLKGAL
jgi:uncharacterized membrane protein (DUF106 family)